MKGLIVLITILLFLIHGIPIIIYVLTNEMHVFIMYIGIGILDFLWGLVVDSKLSSLN